MSAESESPTPSIASLPPGTLWMREQNVPPEECERAMLQMIEAEIPGLQEWMPFKRAIN